jgi:hypothetical protein
MRWMPPPDGISSSVKNLVRLRGDCLAPEAPLNDRGDGAEDFGDQIGRAEQKAHQETPEPVEEQGQV